MSGLVYALAAVAAAVAFAVAATLAHRSAGETVGAVSATATGNLGLVPQLAA
jgi:hypothetical protein